jgi:hypothetical protein
MPPAVIARVTLIGKSEPSIITFTNWQGREIGDHPQDFDPVGDDDVGFAVEFISDVTQEWTLHLKMMLSPQE